MDLSAVQKKSALISAAVLVVLFVITSSTIFSIACAGETGIDRNAHVIEYRNANTNNRTIVHAGSSTVKATCDGPTSITGSKNNQISVDGPGYYIKVEDESTDAATTASTINDTPMNETLSPNTSVPVKIDTMPAIETFATKDEITPDSDTGKMEIETPVVVTEETEDDEEAIPSVDSSVMVSDDDKPSDKEEEEPTLFVDAATKGIDNTDKKEKIVTLPVIIEPATIPEVIVDTLTNLSTKESVAEEAIPSDVHDVDKIVENYLNPNIKPTPETEIKTITTATETIDTDIITADSTTTTNPVIDAAFSTTTTPTDLTKDSTILEVDVDTKDNVTETEEIIVDKKIVVENKNYSNDTSTTLITMPRNSIVNKTIFGISYSKLLKAVAIATPFLPTIFLGALNMFGFKFTTDLKVQNGRISIFSIEIFKK